MRQYGRSFRTVLMPDNVRMLPKAVQQGHSEVRDATKKERHACGRAPSASPRGERVGEHPMSSRRGVAFFTHPPRAAPQLWPGGTLSR
ncbi:MAG: hypothetical protein OJF51_003874 [Nitrospira sp.]|jgi:hypothetical protein|nr:MAG: hypothetical protein OJF51_003874 [Nitrospira sp.]